MTHGGEVSRFDSRRPTLVSLEAPAGPDVTTWDLKQQWELKIEPKLQTIELQRDLSCLGMFGYV